MKKSLITLSLFVLLTSIGLGFSNKVNSNDSVPPVTKDTLISDLVWPPPPTEGNGKIEKV